MENGLPSPLNESTVPTFSNWLAHLLGFQLPAIPLPQTAKNLDKAVGSIFLAAGDNVIARIKANSERVIAGGKIRVDGMYRTEDERRKLQNRADVTALAIREFSTSSSFEDAQTEIDEDWLNLFARIAEDKSSEELKSLFGRILAGEVRRPGAFSLRTLQFLSTLSRAHASQVTAFFAYALDGIVVPQFVQSTLSSGEDLVERLLMEELGIASHPAQISPLGWNFSCAKMTTTTIEGIGYRLEIINNTEAEALVEFQGQVLTQIGQELLPIAGPKPPDASYVRSLADYIFHDLRARHHGESIALRLLRVLAYTRNTVSDGDAIYEPSLPPPS
jgi:hypothetical protein